MNNRTPKPKPSVDQPIPQSILEEAHKIIYGDRERTYGHPSKNLQRIADYWSVHLEREVTINDVCIMMVLMKQARLGNDPTHKDGMVDTCGYMALMERCQKQSRLAMRQFARTGCV